MLTVTLREMVDEIRSALNEKRLVAQIADRSKRDNVFIYDEDTRVGCAFGVVLMHDEKTIRRIKAAGLDKSAVWKLMEHGLVAFPDELTAGLAQATQHLHDQWSNGNWLDPDGMAHFLPFLPEPAVWFLTDVVETGVAPDEMVFTRWMHFIENTFLPKAAMAMA